MSQQWDFFHAHAATSALGEPKSRVLTLALIRPPNRLSKQPCCSAGLTALIPIVRYVLHTTLFKPFGTWALASTELQRKTSKLPPKADHRRKKLTESMWKLTVYSTLLSIGVRGLAGKQWALNTKEWWIGHPNQLLEPEVELYYNAELAFYGASFFMLLVWEERRHDFGVMLIHHAVTIVLITVSYYLKLTRIGAVVMILHDPSDIFLESAKVCNYLGFEAAATALFALLLISWFTLRLVVFPFWLIKSAMFETTVVLGKPPPYGVAFLIMLCALVCMHCYWFALIARVAWLKLKTGNTVDTREDED